MLVRSLVQNTTSPLSSALDAVNCLHHHGVVQRLQVRLLSPLSPLLPLPTWQTREYPPLLQWPHQWHPHRQLSTHPVCSSSHKEKDSAFSQQATDLSCRLLWLCFPRSRKKIPPTKIWCTGMIASTCIHKRNTRSLLSLCAAITAHVRLCSYLSFCADNSTTFAQHADSKMEFQSPYWKSSQACHLTSCRLQSTPLPQRPWHFTLPLAHHHYYDRCAIPHRSSPPSSDKNGALDQNGIGLDWHHGRQEV